MFIRYFSHDVSSVDSLRAEVVGCSKSGCHVVAEACDGEKIMGFCKTMAYIGSKLSVTPVREFPDGGFLFDLESIQYSGELPKEVIRGNACRNANKTMVAANNHVA